MEEQNYQPVNTKGVWLLENNLSRTLGQVHNRIAAEEKCIHRTQDSLLCRFIIVRNSRLHRSACQKQREASCSVLVLLLLHLGVMFMKAKVKVDISISRDLLSTHNQVSDLDWLSPYLLAPIFPCDPPFPRRMTSHVHTSGKREVNDAELRSTTRTLQYVLKCSLYNVSFPRSLTTSKLQDQLN